MYWTDWGDLPKIERSTMAGSSRTVLVQNGLKWPNALAIDHGSETLFWTDANLKIIEMLHLPSVRYGCYEKSGRFLLLTCSLAAAFTDDL